MWNALPVVMMKGESRWLGIDSTPDHSLPRARNSRDSRNRVYESGGRVSQEQVRKSVREGKSMREDRLRIDIASVSEWSDSSSCDIGSALERVCMSSPFRGHPLQTVQNKISLLGRQWMLNTSLAWRVTDCFAPRSAGNDEPRACPVNSLSFPNILVRLFFLKIFTALTFAPDPTSSIMDDTLLEFDCK